ncbi:MAG: hypothetical protein Q8M94_01695 [Ignavibacteria bacterium]|nr:hypothetical protein [Ignavibacteria bacterium]
MKALFMKNKFLITITFFLLISIPINNSYSQQLHKTFEVPGGGSGTTSTSVDSNDDYILYIVGGAVIAGVVIYALLKDKKEKQKQDTIAVILNDDFLEKNLTFNERISNMQSQIPVNISIGMQSDRIIREEKIYFVGLNYNF